MPKMNIRGGKFGTLADSLAAMRPSERLPILRQLANELGAIRATLTPEQHAAFDPAVRVWLREQSRQGYSLAIPGVGPVP